MTLVAQQIPHSAATRLSATLALRTEIVFGAGQLSRLGQLARQCGGRRVLIVTDAGIVQAGHVQRAEEILGDAGLAVARFDEVIENPTTRAVERCVAAARSHRADLLVGLGGGSSIDTAKGCNFLFTGGGRMEDYWGRGKATQPMLPMIAVPTTAGTGSECQSFALVSQEETHAKMACGDAKAAPRIALLDPDLTATQPRAVAAATGLDALSHAAESAVTAARNPFSGMFSREAFRRTARSLVRAVTDPFDLDARADMLLGAALAGVAIENSMLGAAHSAANPLTARYGITHGQAVALMLPGVVRFNAQDEEACRIYAELAADVQLEPAGGDPFLAAESLAAFLEETRQSAGLAGSLAELGIDDPPIESLAAEAARQWTARFNPRPVSTEDFAALYRHVSAQA